MNEELENIKKEKRVINIFFILELISGIMLMNSIRILLFEEKGEAIFGISSLFKIPFCYIVSVISIALSFKLF